MNAHPTHTSFIVVGDVMVDTFARTDSVVTIGADQSAVISRHIGGQGANTAAWLAWLQTNVALIASSGDDPAGQWAIRELMDTGVDTRIRRMHQSTGNCVVIVDSQGSRTMFSDPGANEQISAVAIHELMRLLDTAMPHVHIHVSGYLLERDPGLPRSLLKSARLACPSLTASLDTAAMLPTPTHREGLLDALAHLDVLIGTQEEFVALSDLAPNSSPSDAPVVLDHWRSSTGFTGVLVMKRGRDGSTADNGRERLHSAALPGPVVDTTGAGDAFSAGFLAAWVPDQNNLAAALRSGTQAAATAIGRLGAGPPTAEPSTAEGR